MKSITYINEAGEVTFDAFELSCPKYTRKYFENAVLCGECNGRGCKHCYPNNGIESFWEFMYMRYYRFHEADYITLSMKYNECVKQFENPNR